MITHRVLSKTSLDERSFCFSHHRATQDIPARKGNTSCRPSPRRRNLRPPHRFGVLLVVIRWWPTSSSPLPGHGCARCPCCLLKAALGSSLSPSPISGLLCLAGSLHCVGLR